MAEGIVKLGDAAIAAEADAQPDDRRFRRYARAADTVVGCRGYGAGRGRAVLVRRIAGERVEVAVAGIVIEREAVVRSQVGMAVLESVIDHSDAHAGAAIIVPDVDDVRAFGRAGGALQVIEP